MQDLGHHWEVAAPGISPDFIPTANILVLEAAEFCPSEVRELHGWANTCPSVGSRIGELEGYRKGPPANTKVFEVPGRLETWLLQR